MVLSAESPRCHLVDVPDFTWYAHSWDFRVTILFFYTALSIITVIVIIIDSGIIVMLLFILIAIRNLKEIWKKSKQVRSGELRNNFLTKPR